MKYIALTLIILLTGCTASNQYSTTDTFPATDTIQLIGAAAEASPKGVPGEFMFTIKASGKQRDIIYLNTELDYRDQRNITIAISTDVANYIEQQYQQTALDYYLNKEIKVKGIAQRVQIFFISNGQMSDKYYYQTHIRVSSPEQIEVVAPNS